MADYSLRTYNTWRAQGIMPITANDLGSYGPSYVMSVALVSRLLPLAPPDNRHIIYFLTYLAGVWAFYELGKRWLTPTAALYATLLFTTQPLFWGHAFFNPKDTPFLVFFMLSLLFGLRMADSIGGIEQPKPTPRWQGILTTLGAVTVFGLFAATPLLRAWLETLIHAAQSGATNIISLIASDINKVAPEVYIQKYFVLFLLIRSLPKSTFKNTLSFFFKRAQFTFYFSLQHYSTFAATFILYPSSFILRFYSPLSFSASPHPSAFWVPLPG